MVRRRKGRWGCEKKRARSVVTLDNNLSAYSDSLRVSGNIFLPHTNARKHVIRFWILRSLAVADSIELQSSYLFYLHFSSNFSFFEGGEKRIQMHRDHLIILLYINYGTLANFSNIMFENNSQISINHQSVLSRIIFWIAWDRIACFTCFFSIIFSGFFYKIWL